MFPAKGGEERTHKFQTVELSIYKQYFNQFSKEPGTMGAFALCERIAARSDQESFNLFKSFSGRQPFPKDLVDRFGDRHFCF